MAEFKDLLYSVSDRVATITIDRPQQNNAWTPTLEIELRLAIEEASADQEVRAIILTGAGKSFCVGADIAALKAAAGGAAPAQKVTAGEDDFDQQYSYLLACPKPIIGAINGPAAGVGFCLLLYCDIRYISSEARIATAFVRRGLPAEHGAAWLLPRQVGLMAALDLLLSGRSIDANEAGVLGFAKIVDASTFMQNVQEAASQIANLGSPMAMAAIKRQVYTGYSQSLGVSIRMGDEIKAECRKSEDFKEGIASFVERRPPRFLGR